MMLEPNDKPKGASVMPHRVVILEPSRSGQGQDTGATSKHQSLIDDIRQWIVPIQGRIPVSVEKIGLVVRIMETLTSYYRRPECLEAWTKTAMAGEELRGSELMHHVGLLQCFQRVGQVETDNQDVDWWVFLAPDGLAYWEHPSDREPETLHMVILWVVPNPGAERICPGSMALARLLFLVHKEPERWIQVSRMSQTRVAGIVSRLIDESRTTFF